MLTYPWLLNLASFAGIATLAVPVWSLNKRKRRLQAVKQANLDAKSDKDFRSKTLAILSDKQKKSVEDWRAIDECCLIVGYGLLLGSAFLRIAIPPM